MLWSCAIVPPPPANHVNEVLEAHFLDDLPLQLPAHNEPTRRVDPLQPPPHHLVVLLRVVEDLGADDHWLADRLQAGVEGVAAELVKVALLLSALGVLGAATSREKEIS